MITIATYRNFLRTLLLGSVPIHIRVELNEPVDLVLSTARLFKANLPS
jgi:hypothetical protein